MQNKCSGCSSSPTRVKSESKRVKELNDVITAFTNTIFGAFIVLYRAGRCRPFHFAAIENIINGVKKTPTAQPNRHTMISSQIQQIYLITICTIWKDNTHTNEWDPTKLKHAPITRLRTTNNIETERKRVRAQRERQQETQNDMELAESMDSINVHDDDERSILCGRALRVRALIQRADNLSGCNLSESVALYVCTRVWRKRLTEHIKVMRTNKINNALMLFDFHLYLYQFYSRCLWFRFFYKKKRQH